MIELIMVMVVIAVLAAYAMPRMSSFSAMTSAAWRDQVVTALQYAHSSAVSHRRLVCVSVATGAVSLQIATTQPATSCNANLTGIDGGANFAVGSSSSGVTVSPSGVMYMQPDGRVTTDGAGNTSSKFTVSVSGEDNITVQGETGYVE